MKLKRLFQLMTATIVSLSSILAVTLPVAYAAGNTCTWTGTNSNKFNDAGNWSGCNSSVPVDGNNDILVFDKSAPGVTPGLIENDLAPGRSFGTIIIDGAGANGFTFTGNAFTLSDPSGSITDNSSTAGSYDSFDVSITFSNNYTISVANRDVTLAFGSATNDINGTGNILKQGDGNLMLASNNVNWQGSLTVSTNGGSVIAADANALGASATDAIFNAGSDLAIFSCSDMTFNGHFTLNGDSSLITGDYPNGKVTSAVGCASGGGGLADEIYGFDSQDTSNLTLAGSINLASDVTFAPVTGTTTITGDLLGPHAITVLPGYTGKLVINSSNNASTTPNGTYTSAQFSKTISDSNSNTVEIYKNNVITIDGTRGNTTVHSGGWLEGTGTVGALGVESGGNVGPGHSPGCLNSSNLTIAGNYQAQIGGADPCTGYDQIVVTGSVNVTGGTLLPTLYNGYVPTGGQKFTIISNDGNDVVTGFFNGIAEGGTVTGDGVTYTVSYIGGDGNDVTLTVKSIDPTKLPGKPNTGLALLMANPLLTLLITVTSAGALLYLARRQYSAK